VWLCRTHARHRVSDVAMLSMMPRALRAVGVPQFTASAPPPPAPPPCRALHPRALHLVAHASGGAPRAPRPHASPPPASTLVGEGGAWGVERRAAHRHAGVCHASSFLEEAEVEAPRVRAANPSAPNDAAAAGAWLEPGWRTHCARCGRC
jgi:hypothetical protein